MYANHVHEDMRSLSNIELILSGIQFSSRNSSHNGEFIDVPCHYRSGTDHGALTDCHGPDHRDIGADPNVVLYDDCPGDMPLIKDRDVPS